MAESKPIPVRLSDDIIARLDRAAHRMGTNRAALIRFLVQTFVDDFEKHGGTAGLPHDWREIMKNLDGRTFGQMRQRLGNMKQSMALNESPGRPEPLPSKPVKYQRKKK